MAQGQSVLAAEALESIFRRICDKLLLLSKLGWRPKRDIDNLLIWARREFNTPPDHLANAAMDNDSAYEWRENSKLQQAKRDGESFRICIDGGRRERERKAAIAFAVYSVSLGSDGEQMQRLVWMSAQPVQNMISAFQTEATALEWTLSAFISFLRE